MKKLGQKVLILLVIICSLIMIKWPVLAFSSQVWEEDILFLQNKLPEAHKNLFFKITEQKFNQEIADLLNDLADLTDLEVILRLEEIFSQIGDSHTGVSFAQFINYYYPVSFKKFGYNYYLVGATEEYKELLGSQLISINGQGIETIMDRFAEIIPAENFTAITYQAQNYLYLPEVLQFCKLAGENAHFTLKTENGLKRVALPRKTLKELRDSKIETIKYEENLVQKNPRKLFWYEYNQKTKLLYFQYNQCWGRELEKRITGKDNPALPSFNQMSAELLQILKENDVAKFVIDLRNNPGGSSSQGSEFARQLGELNLDTDIYVIIGNRTFSSAIINAIHFKQYANATLVGEPTKGKPNHYGEVKQFKLPETNLVVFYSTKYFKMVKGDPNSLYPDILVLENFEDFLNGQDTFLNKVKQLK